MNDRLTFCRDYNYPPALTDLLRRIAEVMDPGAVKSAILLGSTARGEFSWTQDNGRFVPRSDIEMLLVTPHRPRPTAISIMKNRLHDIEQTISLDVPSFHIDFDLISEAKLRKLTLIFRTFETRQTGKVIAGESLLETIPAVTTDNLDHRDLNEILIWRLWAMWLHMPMQFVERGPLSVELDEEYAYVVARNLLDLPSWLLPRSGHLVAGFASRLETLKQIWEQMPNRFRYGVDLPDVLGECLAIKLGNKKAGDAAGFYQAAVRAFRAAWAELAEQSDADDEAVAVAIARRSRKLFPDWHWRRKGHQARLVAKNLNRIWVGHTALWLARPKYGPMLNVLMNVHLAVERYRQGDDDAAEGLDRAYRRMQKLSLYDATIPGWRSLMFAERLAGLRRVFADFLIDYVPWVASQRGMLERML